MERRVGDEIAAAVRCLSEAGVESSTLDARLMMAEALGCSRLYVIAHPDRTLTDSQLDRFHLMLERRVSRFPLAYILGHKEFFGIELAVTPDVLIPRPETEILVEACLERLATPSPSRERAGVRGKRSKDTYAPTIADIGAGSGAIAVAVSMNLPTARVYTTEISACAANVAGANIEKHQLTDRITLIEGDLLEPLAELGVKFDAILSNPPYIPSGDMAALEPEVRCEPVSALDGGPDGLDAYRRLLPQALPLLTEAGFVAVEVGAGQADDVRKLAIRAGYTRIEFARDLARIERVVVAYR